MGLSKHESRKKERKKGGGDVYSQTIQNIAREEASGSHIRKGTEVL